MMQNDDKKVMEMANWGMRLLPVLLVLLLIGGVCVTNLRDVFPSHPDTRDGKDVNEEVDSCIIEFDDVNRGEMPLKRIHVMNSSNKAVNPVVMHLPEYLRANVSPTTIPAGKQGVVELTLNSNNVHDYGLTQTSVYLGMQPGDKVSPGKEIEVSVVLLPSFKEMTDRLHLFRGKGT